MIIELDFLQTYIKKFEFYTPSHKNRGRNRSNCN